MSYLLSFLLSFALAHAAALTGTGAGPVIEGVPTAKEAKVIVDGRASSLKVVGAGLRYKKVAFIKAKVYVGELFADAPEKIQRSADGAVGSLAATRVLAMRMTFLRDVDGEKVSHGFRDALEENKVKLDGAAIKAFLDAVKAGGEAKEKKTLVVVGEKAGGKEETVSYENADGKVVTVHGEAGFVRDVFSMWLGRIDDSGLENLKKEILGLQK